MRLYWLMVFVILLLQHQVMAACDSFNTPKLIIQDYFELSEGELFFYKVNSAVANAESRYVFTHIDSSFSNFDIKSKGEISIKPAQEDVGTHKILITGYNNDCFSSELVKFKVFDKPRLIVNPVDKNVSAKEGTPVTFSVSVEDSDPSDNLTLAWYLNGELASNDSEYVYLSNYNSSGTHKLQVKVQDQRNLTDEMTWIIAVENTNRPPYLFTEIPGLFMLTNSSHDIFDLNDYFMDPDEDELVFEVEEVKLEYEVPIPLTDIKMFVNEERVSVIAPLKPGLKFFKFRAEDPSGEVAESDSTKFVALTSINSTKLNYCGDDFCSDAESCVSCKEDCGPCDRVCKSEWKCEDWEPCLPNNIQVRKCTDYNECGTAYDKPFEAQRCEYKPSCFDGVKNGEEEKIDCGGLCEVCPTCSDKLQNQGEEKTDCGGPCQECPGCGDQIKNQNESDVDCGGPCNGCDPGKVCKTDFDCRSYMCREEYCLEATCQDGVGNQGEEKTDCGGPCPACPTCSDKLKNQAEKLVDCGGACDKCSFVDYVKYMEFKYFFFIFIVIAAITLLSIKAWEKRRMYYHSKGAFFEKDTNIGKVIFLHRITKIFTKSIESSSAEEALSKLESEGSENLRNVLDSFFRSALSMSEILSYDEVHSLIKQSKYPFLTKALLIALFRKFWFVKTETVVLPSESTRLHLESTRILTELKKDL